MNTKITKYKNDSSADVLNNRLMRLEKMLKMVIELSVNSQKNQDNSLINKDVSNNNDISGQLLAGLGSLSTGNAGSGNIEAAAFTIRPTVRKNSNTTKTGANNLLLSHGQIIAEIASAIAISGRRNS